MDFDNAKENIQPLASGRNVHQLEIALCNDAEAQHELQQQRHQFESNIKAYTGDDPLELWYEYILWLEQSYPKDSAMDDVLVKCLIKFENEDKYKQDHRMIKLYIKYIDSQQDPQENYQILYNSGIGTKLADLYIGWAYYYDICDNFEKVEDIFQKGKDAGAEPKDVLQQAHKNFGFSMSQRILKKMNRQDFLTTMAENRFALTSLQGHHRKNAIGSIRTGNLVKSFTPGTVLQQQTDRHLIQQPQQQRSNAGIVVFNENQNDGGAAVELSLPIVDSSSSQPTTSSIVTTILNSAKRQENLREPGPWSKAQKDNRKSSAKLFKNCNQSVVNFTIHADDDDDDDETDNDAPKNPYKIPLCDPSTKFDLSIKLPPNFVRQSKPQTNFDVPLYVEEEILPFRVPAYDKIRICPRPDKLFSIEELAAYNWFKRRNIKNKFTAVHDEYWCNGIEYPIRLPPLFARENLPQSIMIFKEKPDKEPPKNCKFMFNWTALYTDTCDEKSSFEENLRDKFAAGELRSQLTKINGMDETLPIVGRRSIYCGAMRKSIVPGGAGRKTILPPINQSIFVRKDDDDDDSDADLDEDSMTEDVPKEMKILNDESKRKTPSIFFSIRSELMPRKSILKVLTQPKDVPVKPTAATGAIPKIMKSKRKSDESGLSDDDPVTNKETCPSQRRQAVTTKVESLSEAAAVLPVHEPPIFTKPTPQFSIFQDFVEPTNDKKQSGAKPTAEPIRTKNEAVNQPPEEIPSKGPFEIFQDTEEVFKSPPTTEPIEFKTPKAPISMLRKSYPTVQFAAAATHATATVAAAAATDEEHIEENQYLPNDSFSTQNFNYFIKAQSISTPISNKRKTPLSVIPPEEISPPTMIDHPHAPDILTPSTTVNQPRQLSIIMETTETTNTKSSVDTQLNSSPESVVGSSSNCTTTTAKNCLTTPILVESNEQPKKSTISQLNELELPSICLGTTTTTNDMTSFNIFSDPIETLPTAKIAQPSLPKCNPIEIYIDKTEDIPQIALKSSTATIPIETNAKENIIFELPINENVVAATTKLMESESKQQFPIYQDETVPTINAINAVYEEKTEIIPMQLLISNREKTLPTSNETLQQPPSIMPSIIFCNDTTTTSELIKTDFIPTEELLVKKKENTLINDSLPALPSMPSICQDTDELEDLFRTTPIKQKNSFRTLRKDEQQQMMPPPLTIPSSLSVSSSMSTDIRQTKIPIRCSKTSISLSTTKPNSSLREQSLHIKQEPNVSQSSIATTKTENEREQPQIMIDFESARHISRFEKSSDAQNVDNVDDENFIDNVPAELSIYAQNFEQSKFSSDMETWDEIDEDFDVTAPENNYYLTNEIDLNQTNQIIDQHLNDPNIDPWNDELKNSLLDRVFFLEYLSKMPIDQCNMMEKMRPIKLKEDFEFCGKTFTIISLIGQGKFGRVYSAKDQTDKRIYALKQERPANLWEYYICLEIVSRIQHKHILEGLMKISHALIAKNASIFVTEYSSYGTLIDVCNKVKKYSGKNVSESVTMVLANQMLLILDHLHAVNIIHGDIKPDNILLMKKINSDRPDIVIQFIDFGQSIDLKLYRKDQQFLTKLSTENFMCTEMLENRPWTYQTDLYCLAGTIHTILFGSYMQVVKKVNTYALKMAIPRYYDKLMWETIFDALINVRSNNMPNLQTMRDNLQKKIVCDERKVREHIMNFNRYLDM